MHTLSRTFFKLFLSVGLLLPLSALAETEDPPSTPPAQASAAANIVVTVDGMVCSFCVQGLERTMLRMEAIEKVALNLEAKTMSLWTQSGQNVSDETLRSEIKASGFDAREIVRKP